MRSLGEHSGFTSNLGEAILVEIYGIWLYKTMLKLLSNKKFTDFIKLIEECLIVSFSREYLRDLENSVTTQPKKINKKILMISTDKIVVAELLK